MSSNTAPSHEARVTPGHVATQILNDWQAEILPTLHAQHKGKKEFNPHQAMRVFMHETYCSKNVVVWILKHGCFTQRATELLNIDTQEILEAAKRKREEAQASGPASSQATTETQARQAAKQRRDHRDAENRREKLRMQNLGPGRCQKCSWDVNWLQECGHCQKAICSYCSVKGHLLCWN